MELDKAIKELFPSAEPGRDFVLQDDGAGPYIKKWNLKDQQGNPVPQPTQTEIEDAYRRYLEKKALTEYREKRRHEYPSIGDQLDCIWKALKGMGLTPNSTLGDNTPEGILARIEEIKKKYPKPR